ncbi:glycosyltransferase family 4 protein [Sulfurimonas sp.]|nr:glycosyltransferase family 4 protein [Sulfurimonas sp.]
MQSKNILEICLADGLGGLELFTSTCYEYFKRKTNCKIIVDPRFKLSDYINSDNPDLSYIVRNNKFAILPAFKLAKFIDENDIDIIHIHWIKDMITVILAKLISKKRPNIVYSRHMNMTRFKDDIYHKWLYRQISLIHTVSEQVKEQAIKFIPSDVRPKVEAIHLGIDEPTIDTNRVEELKNKYKLEDSFVVGIVGRIESEKGQYIVIEALDKLKELNIKLIIVGHTMDENYLTELKQKIKNLDLEDKVIFTGFTREVNEHLKLLDTMILATKKETFGLVVIESMINNTPVIATNAGGPLEIIDNMQDGLFFDRSVEDLVSKIKLLYDDENLRKSLCNGGYQKIKKKFDSKIQMGKLYNYINQA